MIPRYTPLKPINHPMGSNSDLGGRGLVEGAGAFVCGSVGYAKEGDLAPRLLVVGTSGSIKVFSLIPNFSPLD